MELFGWVGVNVRVGGGEILGILGSRVGWAFVVGHWVLFGVGFWEWWTSYSFRLAWEPGLLFLVLMADVLWVVVWDVVVPGSLDHQVGSLLITGLLAGIQWYSIGYGLEWWSESRKLK